jgi:hypothetical protein
MFTNPFLYPIQTLTSNDGPLDEPHCIREVQPLRNLRSMYWQMYCCNIWRQREWPWHIWLNVQSSGRSSSLVNVIDALQAFQMVALPAVHRLHLVPIMEDSLQMMLLGASGSAAAAAVATIGSVKGHSPNFLDQQVLW